MIKIITPAILTTYRPLADKSFNLTFNASIQTPEQKLVVDSLHQQYGFLMFKDSEVEKDEFEIFDSLEADLEDQSKTPSKRLRAVFYLNWKQNPEGFKEFKDFYKSKMELIIMHYKDKLS